MMTPGKPYPRVDKLISGFADWLKHRREINEMRRLDRAEFDRIAGDLRISSDELDELVRHGPQAADELQQLLKALGIDESSLGTTEPRLLRDMERVCALCSHKRECDHDLATGAAAEHYKDYCLNAPTIEELDKAKVN